MKTFVRNSMRLFVVFDGVEVAMMELHPNMVVIPKIGEQYTFTEQATSTGIGTVKKVEVVHEVTYDGTGAVLCQVVTVHAVTAGFEG